MPKNILNYLRLLLGAIVVLFISTSTKARTVNNCAAQDIYLNQQKLNVPFKDCSLTSTFNFSSAIAKTKAFKPIKPKFQTKLNIPKAKVR